MWEVTVEIIIAIAVVSLTGLLLASWALLRTIKLKKRAILLEKHLNTIIPGFGGLELDEIKEGTIDDVLQQMKPALSKKVREGTFVWPKPAGQGVHSLSPVK